VSATAHLQTCRSCAHEFRVQATLIGKQVACPHCRRPMTLVANQVANEDKLVGQMVGGCRLLRRLGAGAIGVVYEAEQESMGRRVAVKMLSSKAAADAKVVQRFQREARLCAQIQHPNVVTVYDCGFERGVHFLVMEFVDGDTLAGLTEEAGRLAWDRAAKLVLQVARGLEYAHGRGIVHRDIKPANVLVGSDGSARLADLGLAKQLEDERSITEGDGLGLTMQGVALGSPAYMPPEQIRSAKDVTPASDLYALGASFYQLVTGALPFDGRSAMEVMTKVLREEARAVRELAPEVPPAIAAFIHRTLSKDPAGRPADAGRFIVELEDALTNPQRLEATAVAPRPAAARRRQPSNPGVPPAAVSQYRTQDLLIIVAVVALVAAGAVAGWWFLLR
jgi:serine/threonine-protein kinase